MNFQATPPNMMPTPSAGPPMGNPPVLGQQVPGMSGGLPALSGLSVMNNPMAQALDSEEDVVASYAGGGPVDQAENVRQYGRGEDTVLVHMTPSEVGGLQALAMAHGGSLTINPHTGLPEAGFLKNVFKKLLPTLAGVGLSFIPGVGPIAAAALTAAGGTAATGSLKKGLMAGLQAYGGASLATSLGSQGVFGAAKAAVPPPSVAQTALPEAAKGASFSEAFAPLAQQGLPAATVAPGAVNMSTLTKGGLEGLAQGFGRAATQGLPSGTPAILRKAAPMLAGMGLMQGVTGALAPSGGIKTPTGQIDNSYQGPYTAQERKIIATPTNEELKTSSGQRRWFDVSMPEIRNVHGQLVQPGSSTQAGAEIWQPVARQGKVKKGENLYDFVPVTYAGRYAEGGEVSFHNGVINIPSGSFIADARMVSERGNGSSEAGEDAYRKLGGVPVKGPGDGVSDSIPALIDGKHKARVARDEVIFPPEAVKRLGGTKKLYAMMNKAHEARKSAKRGQDTGLRRGLV